MSEQTIYARLVSEGMTPAGACGLMGNMAAESAMRANNAQDGMTRLTDEAYTMAVDNGTYDCFVGDCVGYGLCQWTFHTRKAALLAYALERGVSIGDEDMQTEFCVWELKSDFAALWDFLCATDDWYTAADRVCREYERPAICNVAARAGYAKTYYDRFDGSEVKSSEEAMVKSEEVAPSARWTAELPQMATLCRGFGGDQVLVLQALLNVNGYDCGTTGIFDEDTEAAVGVYQHDNGLDADGIAGRMTWAALLS